MYEDKRRKQAKQDKSIVLEQQLFSFLGDMLWGLNKQMDRRLVSTFFGLVMAILMHRHRNHGLLLSELGGVLVRARTVLCGHKTDQQAIAQREVESQVHQSVSVAARDRSALRNRSGTRLLSSATSGATPGDRTPG